MADPNDLNAPEWLDADALAIWRVLVEDLRAQGILKPSHTLSLARYCRNVARWLKLREKVDQAGETYETASKHGSMLRIAPNFTALQQIEARIEAAEPQFGLTPLTFYRMKEIRARAEGNTASPALAQLFGDDEADENGENATAANPSAASPFGILN